MRLILYSVTDANNVINKDLGVGLNVDVMLQADINIISPTIYLASIPDINLLDYNYLVIPDLKRHYFIDDIQSVTGSIIGLHCRCDVLESYKVDILASNARFMRNIKTGDYYDASLDHNINSSISKYVSDGGLVAGESTIIFTTTEI